MKIFAKRKKKDPTTTGVPAPQRTTFSSDPVVEELLSKDPSEWNSKERRMVKRYQLRKDESVAAPEASGSLIDETARPIEAHSVPRDMDDNEEVCAADSNECGDRSPVERSEQRPQKKKAVEGSPNKVIANVRATEGSGITEVGKVDAIWGLLEQLSSKMKRTFTRKLDRGGIAALEDVRKDTNLALGLSVEPTQGKRDISPDDAAVAGKQKKRKTKTDWSALSAEERLRREEQRRLQKEAAGRRSRGEDKSPGFKHPLNSERRRANRRKPKWQDEKKTGFKNDHDSSGYMHRKEAGEAY